MIQEFFLLFSIVNNQGLVENTAEIMIYSIYFSPFYMYLWKIIVHLLPWFSWKNQVFETSLMDLEKYEYNFFFPFFFLTKASFTIELWNIVIIVTLFTEGDTLQFRTGELVTLL